MLTFVFAIVVGLLQGGEKKPVVTPSPQSKTAQQAQSAPPPISVTVVSPPKDEEEKRQEAADRKAEADDRSRDVKAQETMASFTQRLFWLGFLQLLAAAAAVWAALEAVKVNRASAKHFQITERAWLGAVVTPEYPFLWSDKAAVKVRITNHGNTPARVTMIWHRALAIEYPDQLPPAPPDYGGYKFNAPFSWTKSGFLVKGDSLESSGSYLMFEGRNSSGSFWKNHSVFVIGYCDYIDAFGDRHRLGWARQCSYEFGGADAPGLRIHMQTPTNSGYEYERLRKPGEGNDWDNQPS